MVASIRVTLLVGLLLLPLSEAEAGKIRPRTKVRDVDVSTVVASKVAISNVCGNGAMAGIESVFNAKLSRLGKLQVSVSASWDWGSSNSDHPAALVNVSPQELGDYLNACATFTSGATVRLVRIAGAILNPGVGDIIAEITGGSVYEVVVAPDARVAAADHGGTCPAIGVPGINGTINESITNFEADPSDPDTPRGSISGSRWVSSVARITGTIRTRLNSCTGEAKSFLATKINKPY
ncbi:MAG: hypothetical protein P8R42_12950 [Candidatus Binatia bacterium]|nr:hypothetical protein [Candidatus Binatia bacterium]